MKPSRFFFTSAEEDSSMLPSPLTFANIPARFWGEGKSRLAENYGGRRFIKDSVSMRLYCPFQGVRNRTASNIVKKIFLWSVIMRNISVVCYTAAGRFLRATLQNAQYYRLQTVMVIASSWLPLLKGTCGYSYKETRQWILAMHRYKENEINLVYEDVLLKGIKVYYTFRQYLDREINLIVVRSKMDNIIMSDHFHKQSKLKSINR